MRLLVALSGLAAVAVAVALPSGQAPADGASRRQAATWPNGPFVVSDRWILDASGRNLTYAGVNWPGHNDVMIPEGLQYQSVEAIVRRIKSLGMNAVRLTFATQMVDDMYANGGRDVSIERAFARALGPAEGARVLGRVLARNPQFSASTTRLQVFDAVAEALARHEIYIHLDNHISKGMWCCSSTDGNSWWGDTYFSTANWTRGLAYMAKHGKSWPALMSIGLRNEPREPANNPALSRSSYNWQSWYGFMRQGAEAVHASNADLLIFLAGLSFDTYLTPVVRGEALAPGAEPFRPGDFAGYADKLVLELHNYETGIGSCDSLRGNLHRNGFEALATPPTAANVLPVLLTEFGFPMDAHTWRGVYASCLASYLPEHKAGWFLWVLAGSYYIRSGTHDYDEDWGLLNHDWSAWRSPQYVDGALRDMVRNTLS